MQPMQKQVDTNFSLVNGEEKFLMNSFRFKIIEINDSRCPIGVKCFTAGDVKVKAQIESQIYTFILKANSDALKFTHKNYTIELINVLPHTIYQVKDQEEKKTVWKIIQ